MSDDSISRHEVLRIIRTMPPEEGSTKALLEMSVKQLPSTEPIRCKDCKHSEFWYRDKRRCFLWHEEGISVFNDGFCNYAESRTDADMRGERDG